MQNYWDRHPFHYEIVRIVGQGHWITHLFEWLFMMVSRFAGCLMTLAIGYLIYYAIEFEHGLGAVSAHPQFPDVLASLSNTIINVGPELVFPGVVVMCIRAFTARRWVDGTLYAVTSIAFVILTMVLLKAFEDNAITRDFLSAMLFWRAFSSLFYTAVVAYCSGHGDLDLRSLFAELNTLRVHLDSGQQEASRLQEQVSTLQQALNSGQQEMSSLHVQLSSEQQRTATLQRALDDGHREMERVQEHLDTTLLDAQSLRAQLDSEREQVSTLQHALDSGQQDVSRLQEQVSTLQQALDSERQRASRKQRSLDSGQEKVVRLDTTRSGRAGQDERVIAEQIRALLSEEPGLSGRALASRLGCSPTTATKWKGLIEQEKSSTECVNE